MTDTVIFDLDGTLLNTLDDLTDATNHVLKLYDYPLRSKEEVKSYVGNGLFKLIASAIPVRIADEELNKAYISLREYYTDNCKVKTKPYDGIIEVLAQLKMKGYKTAVISNKNDAAVKALVKFYFDDYINIAVGEREGIRRKPAPDSLIEVMKLLDSKRENTVYVGDSEVDKETADNAHVRSVLVSWGFRSLKQLEACKPDIVINAPHELFAHIQ